MTSPFLPHPPGWRVATLEPDPNGDVLVHATSGGTPRTSEPEFWDGRIPWLTPKEVTADDVGIYVTRTERSITERGLAESAASLLGVGTVMLTKRAPVGSCVVNAVPMCTNQGFLNLTCGPAMDPVYLCLWLRANRAYLDAVANGSTYPELYPGDLFEFEIAFPDLDEQRRIAKFMALLELLVSLGRAYESSVPELSELTAVREDTQRLKEVRDLLLVALLAGEVTVPNFLEVDALMAPVARRASR